MTPRTIGIVWANGARTSVGGLALLLAVVLAGCGSSGLPAPTQGPGAETASPSPVPSESAAPPTAVPTPSVTPVPTPTEVPGPPTAGLDGVPGADAPVLGSLGAFSWDGLVSDSPWLVPSTVVTGPGRTPFTLALDPSLPAARWTVAWAPVHHGVAGDPMASEATSGDGLPISLHAPAGAGAWGLQVEVTFSDGNRAAWYWQVRVTP